MTDLNRRRIERLITSLQNDAIKELLKDDCDMTDVALWSGMLSAFKWVLEEC